MNKALAAPPGLQPPRSSALSRLRSKDEFERVLKAPASVIAKSSHFAIHFLATPGVPGPVQEPVAPQLSTGQALSGTPAVDVSLVADHSARLGCVLPKRWARRSVTRSLLKRQIHATAGRMACVLPAGLWVVRLRAAFDREQFPSAASDALRLEARAELEQVLAQAAQRARRQPRGAAPGAGARRSPG